MPASQSSSGSGPWAPFDRDDARNPQRLIREALTAALATIDRETGHPYASLVAVATAPDGTPLLLLSTLARHTRNLQADPRASLLVTSRATDEDPLTAPRLTLLGTAGITGRANAKARYIARHPAAAGYAEFADFAVYELTISGGHLVAGFGRISSVPADRLTSGPQAEALAAVETEIVAHMNEDHADAVTLFARAAGLSHDGTARFVGIDPFGCDVVSGDQGLRLEFASPAVSADLARQQLVALTRLARGSS